MEYLPIILSLVAVLAAIYYYCFKGLNYFKDHGVMHIPPIPIFGNMGPLMFRQKSMAHVVQDTYNLNREAKYVGFFDFLTPIVMIRDPELIKSVGIKHFEQFQNHRTFVSEVQDPLFGKNLFSLNGDRWRDVRSLLSPAFTSSKMKSMFRLMSDCAATFAEFMANLPEEKKSLELKDSFSRYTNDVIATCAFGISVDSMNNPTNEFYVNGREATDFRGLLKTAKLFASRSFPTLAAMLGVRLIPKRIANFFNDLIASTIKTRDDKGINRPDMIQLMMDSRNTRGPGKDLTIEDMTSQAFIFFFGGFDTISTCMSFVAYELAVKPDVLEKLQKEVDKAFEETNGQLTYDVVNKMEYLDAVINETLRVYPVAVFLDRVCEKSFELPPALPGEKPFVVEKGTNVWFPVYGIHHDPKYYTDPEVFDPERFINDGKSIMNSGAYIPFGVGPRMCIGNRFALLETKVLLCHLVARCDIKRSAKTPVPLVLDKATFVMLAEGGFWVKMEPRKNPPACVRNGMTNGACKA